MGQQDFDKKIESLLSKTVPLIKSDELETRVDRVVILDARSDEEFAVSHIKGAKYVNYKKFDADMVGDLDKNDTVVVYCSVGYRSEKIGEKLQKLGFKNVYNLYGGIFDWKNTGRKVVNPDNAPTDSVHTYNKSWSKYLTNGVKVYD